MDLENLIFPVMLHTKIFAELIDAEQSSPVECSENQSLMKFSHPLVMEHRSERGRPKG